MSGAEGNNQIYPNLLEQKTGHVRAFLIIASDVGTDNKLKCKSWFRSEIHSNNTTDTIWKSKSIF